MAYFDLISADDPKWSSYLERTDHDFFHTAACHRLWEHSGDGRAFLAVYGVPDEFVAWPYMLNSLDLAEGSVAGADATSVYGYGGPVTHASSGNTELLDGAWRHFVRCWREQGVVSVFTRLHPILANDRFAGGDSNGAVSGPGVIYHGHTIGIDLTEPEEETWRKYDRRLRNYLRRACDRGCESIYDGAWRYLEEFLEMYGATMTRNHASAFYFFPREHFESLKQALGPHGSLVALRHKGQIKAISLLIEYNGIATTYLTASEFEVKRDIEPAKLLIHETHRIARRRGNRVLHLGGGRGNSNDDSLFLFKSAFSPTRYRYSSGRWILDQARYDQLTKARLDAASASGEELQAHFFPAYRAPFTVGHASALCVSR